ncbi:MAG TPA: HAD-IIB family hydrolase [Candidatus Paceibacterota bacterium]|nr:HAD-IIB family hydrolase [Candidatus Paceibacterota bacterium]
MKAAFFDIDNTLTESRAPISEELAGLLSRLIDAVPVALISGGSAADIESQVVSRLSHTRRENLYLVPTEGAELRAFEDGSWKTVYARPIPGDKKRRILDALERVAPAFGGAGAYVEDRGGLVAYHGLGKGSSLEEKYAWDPAREKRIPLVKALRALLPDAEIGIAGSTTVNVSDAGVDKAYGIAELLKRLSLAPADAIFVGDALCPGGNDEPALDRGVRVLPTSGPSETAAIIGRLLNEAGDSSGRARPRKVAYFCMEYGLEDDLPIFAGGLGILAGDIVRAAGTRSDISLTALGLINRRGMKSSENKGDVDYALQLAQRGYAKTVTVEVPIAGRVVRACAWRKSFGSSEAYLFDTALPENAPQDRKAADFLYQREQEPRIVQELVLGVGGVRLLGRLGIVPDAYHFNEGHTGFGALAAELEASAPRGSIVATKHTILPGAGTYLSRADFERYLGAYIRGCGGSVDGVFSRGALSRDKDIFSTTRFLLGAAGRSTGVSQAHVAAEKVRYPHSPLFSIVNGVDPLRWAAPSQDKAALRAELVRFANQAAGSRLDPGIMTVVWARRFVAYKRPGLLLGDAEALLALVSDPERPMQFIFAGKAYQDDEVGVQALARIRRLAQDPRFRGRIAYIPDYSISAAKKLVQGADVWLNTPIPGFEACGTSGMKAGLNGALVLSAVDGWVAEAKGLAEAGWLMSERNIERELYRYLRAAAAEFGSARWEARAAAIRRIVGAGFTVQRMLDIYLEKLYTPTDEASTIRQVAP